MFFLVNHYSYYVGKGAMFKALVHPIILVGQYVLTHILQKVHLHVVVRLAIEIQQSNVFINAELFSKIHLNLQLLRVMSQS